MLHRQGLSIPGIARDLKMSRKTVREYLRDPRLAPVYGSGPAAVELDPFKDDLKRRISEAATRVGCRRPSLRDQEARL